MSPLGPDMRGSSVLGLVRATATGGTSSVLKADRMTLGEGGVPPQPEGMRLRDGVAFLGRNYRNPLPLHGHLHFILHYGFTSVAGRRPTRPSQRRALRTLSRQLRLVL